MPSKTRQRELARLRARREQERRQMRRRRAMLAYGTLGIVIVVAAVGGGLLLANRPQSKPSASPSTTTPAATTVAPTGARIDAPSAPETVACGGKLPPRHAHPTAKSAPTTRLDPGKTYTATFQTSCGSFSVRVDPSSAPIAAANFVSLARKGFYDSTWFHRILPGGDNIGVIQGGDPKGTGQGGPGYTIKDEPAKGKAYTKYTIAMAKGSAANSAGSQFFINTQDNNNAGWNNTYAVFGKVVSGQSVVDKIGKTPVGGANGDSPTQAVWIEKLTVKTS
ncbi:MAG TPA: peptidylprolyl isomerase [Actinomycetota bacterium]|jgi:cyclophilin family peptidyl-prolyl cis-trans isomerase|nr:peptidylprolyl isomerase [Actinomycetota bacterium]